MHVSLMPIVLPLALNDEARMQVAGFSPFGISREIKAKSLAQILALR
jgi:hypothetical protein